MIPSVKRVPSCGMCMMGCFFVLSALVMLGCFSVVTRGVRMVLRRLLVMLGCFLGHRGVSSVWWPVILVRVTCNATSAKAFRCDMNVRATACIAGLPRGVHVVHAPLCKSLTQSFPGHGPPRMIAAGCQRQRTRRGLLCSRVSAKVAALVFLGVALGHTGSRVTWGACGEHVGTCARKMSLLSGGSSYFCVRQNVISRCRVNLCAAARVRDRVPLDRFPLSPASRTRARQRHVRKVPILLQKSKIENTKNFAKVDLLTSLLLRRFFNASTEVRDRFWMSRYGSSPRRALDASAL
jgi:hypothetical protein